MQTLKLRGFAPDLDPLTPGIFASCDNIFGTLRGFRPFPGLESIGTSLPEPLSGAAQIYYPDGLSRTFLGTHSAIYSLGLTGGPTDVSGGQVFGSSSRWRFDQFGKHTIATNAVDPVQLMTSFDPAFAPLGGDPPVGALVVVIGFTVFIIAPPNTPDTVAWSGLGNDMTWAPSPATQAGSIRIVSVPGPILAAHKLFEDLLVLYKERATITAQYVGPPVIWEFRVRSSQAGAVGQDAVVDVEDSHIIVGKDDFYTFNGAGPPRSLETPLRSWFFETELDTEYRGRIIGRWDRLRDLVVFHYPSRFSGVPGKLDRYIAWARRPNVWTQGELEIEGFVRADRQLEEGVTYDGFGDAFGPTYDEIPEIAYEDVSITGTTHTVDILIGADHEIFSATADPGSSRFMTSDVGDGSNYYFLRRLRPQFSLVPTTPVEVALFRKDRLGAEARPGQVGTYNERFGWVNMRQSARLHQAEFRLTGAYEIGQLDIDYAPAGER